VLVESVLPHSHSSPVKAWVQQEILQPRQLGVLPLVDAGEVLGWLRCHSIPSFSMMGRSVLIRPLSNSAIRDRMNSSGSSILGR